MTNDLGLEDETGTYALIEPGVYEAVLKSVTKTEYENKNPAYGEIGEKKISLCFTFEETSSGTNVVKFTSLKRSPKSHLFATLKGLNQSRELPPEVLASGDAVSDFINSKLGECFFITVSEVTNTQGVTKNSIDSISSKPKGIGAKPQGKPEKVKAKSLKIDDILGDDNIPF